MASFSPKIRKLYKIGATKFVTLPAKLIGENWLKQLHYDPMVYVETLNNKEFIVFRKPAANSFKAGVVNYGLYCFGLSQYVISKELYVNTRSTDTVIVQEATKDYVSFKLFIK
jgi:hypothetical protein